MKVSNVESEVCKLCGSNSKLCNSHILPEFFYLDLYEEHKTLQITKDGEKILQKGIREYLLCQQCETKLSRYEKYAKELIQRIPAFPINNDLGFLYSEDVNYPKFKLFQLSMLWRAGISTHKAFAQVSLGPHEEKIRKMLYEENPGKVSDYGCLMSIIPNSKMIHKVLQSPTKFPKKFFGHNAYKFVTGNLTWVFVVTSHHISSMMKELFFQESGVLRIMSSRHSENSEIMRLARILQGTGKGSR